MSEDYRGSVFVRPGHRGAVWASVLRMGHGGVSGPCCQVRWTLDRDLKAVAYLDVEHHFVAAATANDHGKRAYRTACGPRRPRHGVVSSSAALASTGTQIHGPGVSRLEVGSPPASVQASVEPSLRVARCRHDEQRRMDEVVSVFELRTREQLHVSNCQSAPWISTARAISARNVQPSIDFQVLFWARQHRSSAPRLSTGSLRRADHRNRHRLLPARPHRPPQHRCHRCARPNSSHGGNSDHLGCRRFGDVLRVGVFVSADGKENRAGSSSAPAVLRAMCLTDRFFELRSRIRFCR